MTSDTLLYICYNDTFASLTYEGIIKPEDLYMYFLFSVKYNSVSDIGVFFFLVDRVKVIKRTKI